MRLIDLLDLVDNAQRVVLMDARNRKEPLFRGRNDDLKETEHYSSKKRLLNVGTIYNELYLVADEYRTDNIEHENVTVNNFVSNTQSEYEGLEVFNEEGKRIFYDGSRLWRNKYGYEGYIVRKVKVGERFIHLNVYRELAKK